ncbi:hypothetical protein OESDEN_20086 [Oesophagostomum dentatum]|uniref:Uncharacterized protein n=1 Tax=Oesophagostomum dentatum TaxID=61180 RepID=A0A0B1S4H7_OESDE|nr:hypothetical protein OESDEN_20086 [Oesophagostomum dentatum]
MTPKCSKGVYKEGFPQTFNKVTMEDGCQIEKSSGALTCTCSKDYCSSDHTFIMGLWEKSPMYKPDHEYTECLETILRSVYTIKSSSKRRCEVSIKHMLLSDMFGTLSHTSDLR